ncbi:MAG: hypothetical protein V4700_00570 [Pseudomonadota bacterium]
MKWLIVLTLSVFTTFSFASTCTTGRTLLFEHKLVKAWDTTICPGHPLPLHIHSTPLIMISDTDADLVVKFVNGKEIALKFLKGVPRYFPTSISTLSHRDFDPTHKTPYHFLVFGLKGEEYVPNSEDKTPGITT